MSWAEGSRHSAFLLPVAVPEGEGQEIFTGGLYMDKKWLGEIVGGVIGGTIGAVVGASAGIATGGAATPATVPAALGGAGIGATLGRWVETGIRSILKRRRGF